jgi:reversibly glycosylated polypeptide/UDP-arabinopyranose mutase
VNALVVPTNSAERLAHFLEAWTPWPWDRIVVVQDAPTVDLHIPERLKTVARDRLEAFSWAEIDAMLPEPSIISRQDSAIRSFGYWRAWATGAEVIFTLDDDCFPTEEDLVAVHRDNLYRTPAWQSSVPGLRVRGLPYRNARVLRDVHVSMGLWRGSPDLDAVMTLAGGQPEAPLAGVLTRVMSPGQYFPLCGMNLAFRREVACLMYSPPMGRGQPFARFDDIWCGLVVQRICRHLHFSITCGRPLVDHRRASDPFANLTKEAPGITVNEHLWEAIDAVELSGDEPVTCMQEIGAALAQSGDEYLAGWGRAIAEWCGLFEPVVDPLHAPIAART